MVTSSASTATFGCAGEHFSDFGEDVVVVDEAGVSGAEEFCALIQDAFAAVGEEARAGD